MRRLAQQASEKGALCQEEEEEEEEKQDGHTGSQAGVSQISVVQNELVQNELAQCTWLSVPGSVEDQQAWQQDEDEKEEVQVVPAVQAAPPSQKGVEGACQVNQGQQRKDSCWQAQWTPSQTAPPKAVAPGPTWAAEDWELPAPAAVIIPCSSLDTAAADTTLDTAAAESSDNVVGILQGQAYRI